CIVPVLAVPSNVSERPEFEANLVLEINSLRERPWKYEPYLSAYQELLRRDVLYLPYRKPFKLYEGAGVLQIAKENIVKRGITGLLTRSVALDSVARSHLKDLLDNPALGHTGKDGATFATRIRRQINPAGPVGENITFNDATPRQALLTMVIDDGVATRQHRENIFSPDFMLIGTACGTRSDGQNICVVVFAAKLIPAGIREL
ncbi:MAG: CAP domain-containing protein, partial [Acidobacteriota bacterium]|nr:CAP domain-containing protein [Acidobacteriota bacterium]